MRVRLSALAALMMLAPLAEATAAAPAERRQVLVMESHIESFLTSYERVRATLQFRGYAVSARDMRGRLRELEAVEGDMYTRAMLDGVVRDSGFVDYTDWLAVTRSVLVAERYLADPPQAAELEQSIAELKGDPFLTNAQKVRLIASLRRTESRTAVLRPLRPNVGVVAPYADRIREVVGFRR